MLESESEKSDIAQRLTLSTTGSVSDETDGDSRLPLWGLVWKGLVWKDLVSLLYLDKCPRRRSHLTNSQWKVSTLMSVKINNDGTLILLQYFIQKRRSLTSQKYVLIENKKVY